MKRNGTIYQNFTINTGHLDYKNIGKVIDWNGLKYNWSKLDISLIYQNFYYLLEN
jgi:hypothetical protein